MAEQAKTPESEDEELLLNEEDQVDPDEPKGDEDDADPNVSDEDGEGEEEELLTFGDDLAEEKPDDNSTIKALRDELKRVRKEAREAREAPKAEEAEDPGPEPTLEDCDFDEDLLKQRLREHDRKVQAANAKKSQSAEAQQKEAEAWAAEVKRYKDDLGSLGYADAEDAEEMVASVLNEVQQAVLVKVADRPGKVLYALAKHPDRLTQLATVTDPLKFAGAIARLEGQLKVVKKRKAPDPEQIERGSGSVNAGRRDRELEKLEKEADRTGDRTKVIAYRRKLREAAR